MPREIRTIKRTMFTDEKLASVSRTARLTFIGLLPNSDDYGRLKGDPRLLKAAIYPLDDDVTAKTVAAEVDELEAIGVVKRYVVAGVTYLQIVNFEKHQVMNRKYRSDIPDPALAVAEQASAGVDAPPTQNGRSARAGRAHSRKGIGAERSGELPPMIETTPADAPPGQPPFSLAPYILAYRERFDADPPGGRTGAALKRLEKRHGHEETLRRWRIFVPLKGQFGAELFERTWADWANEQERQGPELIDGIPNAAMLAATAPHRGHN